MTPRISGFPQTISQSAMNKPRALILSLVVILVHFSPISAVAQDALKLSGSIFSDYAYLISSPDEDREGENGFGFRRVYLTADYVISEAFSGRVRFEGADNSTTAQGKPAPFVKDLYVKWNDALGDGHSITFGLSSPPLWGPAEKQWGYRSLEKTIQDRTKIASSRDMGITFKGPLTSDGRVSYAAMVGNNSSGKAESDKFKRAYAQLEFKANDQIGLTLGGDYYQFDGGSSFSVNSFVGYTAADYKLGVESYLSPKSYDDEAEDDTRIGVSLFGQYQVSDTKRLIARYDFFTRDDMGAESDQNWAVLGLAFSPEDGIEIIPNVIYSKNDYDEDATINARVTITASF